MRYLLAALLCAMGLTANARTVDYTASKDPNGFNVYRVTKDAATKVTGSPFGSSLVKYVWTDGSYVYAVTGVPTPNLGPGTDFSAQVVTYAIADGEPKQVAAMTDNELADSPCGPCFLSINAVTASPQHVFMKLIQFGEGYALNNVHVYHKHGGGTLHFMCDIHFDINYLSIYDSSISDVRVDANEIYAYVDYIDYDTQLPMTGIYDISTDACKAVGKLAR